MSQTVVRSRELEYLLTDRACIGFWGLDGSGKTIMQTILAKYTHDLDNEEIKANYELTFGDKINPNDMLHFNYYDITLLIDEADSIFDSRYNSKANRLFSYFIKQKRKRKTRVIFNNQLFSAVDKRLKKFARFHFFCDALYRDGVKVGLQYDVLEKGEPLLDFTLPLEIAKRYYDLYDTEEIITPLELQGYTLKDYAKLLQMYKKMPTKTSFIAICKRLYPLMIGVDITAVYDCLKVEAYPEAKMILGIDVDEL